MARAGDLFVILSGRRPRSGAAVCIGGEQPSVVKHTYNRTRRSVLLSAEHNGIAVELHVPDVPVLIEELREAEAWRAAPIENGDQ